MTDDVELNVPEPVSVAVVAPAVTAPLRVVVTAAVLLVEIAAQSDQIASLEASGQTWTTTRAGGLAETALPGVVVQVLGYSVTLGVAPAATVPLPDPFAFLAYAPGLSPPVLLLLLAAAAVIVAAALTLADALRRRLVPTYSLSVMRVMQGLYSQGLPRRAQFGGDEDDDEEGDEQDEEEEDEDFSGEARGLIGPKLGPRRAVGAARKDGAPPLEMRALTQSALTKLIYFKALASQRPGEAMWAQRASREARLHGVD